MHKHATARMHKFELRYQSNIIIILFIFYYIAYFLLSHTIKTKFQANWNYYYHYLFHSKIIRTKIFDISLKKLYKKSIRFNCYQKVCSSLLGHDKAPKKISSDSGNYKRSYRSRISAGSLSREDFALLSKITHSSSDKQYKT